MLSLEWYGRDTRVRKMTHAEAGRLGGKKGGPVRSIRKHQASVANGFKGGRPRKETK